jgi:hypothetical protein
MLRYLLIQKAQKNPWLILYTPDVETDNIKLGVMAAPYTNFFQNVIFTL